MRNLKFKRILALVLAMLAAITTLGCSSEELGDALELAGDVLEIVGELAEDTTELENETVQPDTLPESENPKESEKAPDISKPVQTTAEPVESAALDEDGEYSSKDDVALYIHTYGKLPKNFKTKSEAGKLGWEGGSLEKYAPGCLIGGDRFGNREGLLPTKKGRTYTECDIDTLGKSSRGSKRIVFSNDGLVYYTDDHYESFTLLYGEE